LSTKIFLKLELGDILLHYDLILSQQIL